jgi:shikimate kinase
LIMLSNTAAFINALKGLITVSDRIKNKNLVLTGFMGTGKTTVGSILASSLKRTLLDTDQMIEEKTGLTLSQIFETYGESYFRDLESEEILRLKQYRPGSLVIATGGGAVLRGCNLKVLSENGIIIALTASSSAILRRISKTNQRPLLAGEGAAEKIKTKLREREVYYRQCSFQLDTTGRTPQQVAREVIAYITKL